MKTPGEAAMDLPWLAPTVASMTTLARSSAHDSSTIWMQVRTDPGMVLLSARCLESSTPLDTALLEAILQHQSHFHVGFVDWARPGADTVHQICCKQADLARQFAEKLSFDAHRAWIAGFLAPLGWLAVAAAVPDQIENALDKLHQSTDASGWQRHAWGHDHTALARRLSRCWRLPAWLVAILGNLGLSPAIAERLGADPTLFRIVQLTVLLAQERKAGLGLIIGADIAELLSELKLSPPFATDAADQTMLAEVPVPACEAPSASSLLPELLQLALDNRRQNDAAWIERLHLDLDQLQQALMQQCADEKNRLQTQKLSALAEFAAGAGHEINNPLAVISGQAQYVLKQMDWLDVPAEEIENVAEYLENLRGKITPSLQKIIGQTQRVHTILTDLMRFARPSRPNARTVSVRALMSDVADSLQELAQQRKVQMFVAGLEHDELLLVDETQARMALGALVRNALEWAPAEGWAKIRVERKNGALDLIVEDNGAGPCPTVREHLFDPFYSGRSAGRGRGMGLPIAWRLARQQGGDVRFDSVEAGVTRFVLTLPIAPLLAHRNGDGYHVDIDAPAPTNSTH